MSENEFGALVNRLIDAAYNHGENSGSPSDVLAAESALITAWITRAPSPEGESGSPTWPIVLAFAKRMEAKLAKNRHKGDREGWLKDHPQALWSRIDDEHLELYEAIGGNDPEAVWKEAADVANFAMMVADSFAALNPERKET